MSALDELTKAADSQTDIYLDKAYQAEAILADATKRYEGAKGVKAPARKGKTLANITEQLDEYTTVLDNADVPTEAKNLLAAAARVVPQIEDVDARLLSWDRMRKDIDNGMLPKIMRDSLEDGYEVFRSSVQGVDLAIDSKVRRALLNIDNADAQGPGRVGQGDRRLHPAVQGVRHPVARVPSAQRDRCHVHERLRWGVDPEHVGGVRVWRAYTANPKGEWWKTLPDPLPRRRPGRHQGRLRLGCRRPVLGGRDRPGSVQAGQQGDPPGHRQPAGAWLQVDG